MRHTQALLSALTPDWVPDMSWTTPDLCDRFPDVVVAAPIFRSYGGCSAFAGPLLTVKCFEDNSRVRELAAEPGEGRVLVVDGHGSLRYALLGDQIAQTAVGNGWAGIVVHGCVRDVEVLTTLPLGVMALHAIPRRTQRRGLGEVGVVVHFADVTFVSGHWLYADANGLLLSSTPLVLDGASGT